ncbi:MAG: mutY [Bacteroidetes bacterium]|jgi:A/G-specific adenine glycosylase|nr:mutY [Bacteroidota bacterium]
MTDFSQKITTWYKKNKRDLPWRNTQDPYKIWLSEIILQQTRVEQGMSYYFAFTENYPTIKHLAKAPIGEVMKTWQGLGYYSRARNIYATANTVVNEHKSVFPTTYDEILKLKGIGPYTAAAIASFCYNEAQAVVDGNVYRVLSRVFGIDTPIDSTAGKKQFQQLATEVLNKKKPGLHNQAIMEFGALQCKPQNPDCEICPLNTDCVAFAEDRIGVLPVKEKKTKVRTRYFYYLLIEDAKKNTLLRKRTAKDIWTELFEFPMIESDKELKPEKAMNDPLLKKIAGKQKYSLTKISTVQKHQLSHQTLYAHFVHIKTDGTLEATDDFILTKMKDIKQFALPRLIDRYLFG